MKSGMFADYSKNAQAEKRSLKAALLNGRLLARASSLLLLLGLAIVSFYSPSSASAPVNMNRGNTASPISAAALLPRPTRLASPSLAGFLPQPLLGGITTYDSNCTTPKDNFTVGETVCVKVTDITLSPSFPRRLTWAAPDSTIVQSAPITTDPQSGSLLLTATSVVNGRTIDNRGTWQLLVRNPFFYFPEASATFTVTDPQSPTADLGVAVTARSNNVASGSQAVFEIQVSNYGPDNSANVQLTSTVPANTTFVSFQQLNGPVFTCSSPIEGATGTTTCSLTSLESPENSVSTFIATYLVDSGVASGTEITDSADISSTATQASPATADQNDKDDSSSASETVVATPCVLTCPSNIAVSADSGQAGAVVSYTTPTFTGDCGQPTTGEGGETTSVISCSPASGSFFGAGTTTVVCSGQGGGVCTFLVTVDNPGALSITLNGANPIALECGEDFSDPGATAVNGNGDPVTVEVTGALDNHTPGSYTLSYTATEGQNSTSTTRTVNVSDSAGPAITISGSNPMTLSCGQTFVDPGASADDACEGGKSVSSSGTVNTNVPGTYTITYTASDSANHTSTATRTVVVEAGGGTAAPTITLNGDPQMTVECGSFSDPGATASVPCGGSAPVTTSGTVSNSPGSYTITYTACIEDSPGHCDPARTSHAERTVIVEDTTAPTITLDGANPLQVECHSTFSDPGATANDACAANFAATASGTVDANTVGSYTVTYNAQDPSGNHATAVTRTVNVVDTTPPTITTCPTSQAANANSSCQAAVPDFTGSAVATDLCGGAITVTQSPLAGSLVGLGSTSVTITAKDSYNNSATCVTVFAVNDNTPPTITAPASASYQCAGSVPAANPADATASDSCSTPTVTVNETNNGGAGSTASPLVITRVFTATDAAGQSASASQTITVIDNTVPSITAPANSSYQCASAVPAANPSQATASDNCSTPTVTVSQTDNGGSGSPANPLIITRTYTATDAFGNSASASQTITVSDNTPPVIALTGANPQVVECHTSYIELGAVATDNCSGTSPATPSGTVNVNVVGSYTVSYSATDAAGNALTPVTRTVNVVDTTKPVITRNGAGSMTVECHTSFTDPGATAADSCDSSVPVSVTGSVNVNTPGTYTLIYNATDDSGNTAIPVTRTVNVVDSTAPVIAVSAATIAMWPPNHQFETFTVANLVTGVSDSCNSGLGISSVKIASVTSDEANTSGDMIIAGDCKSVQLRREREGGGNGRVYIITFRVTDASGNVGFATKKITVPHDQGGGGAVDSGVQSTVTGNCP